MQIMVRIAAGIAVGLVVFAAGCSAILSGATSDAMGGIATPKAALLVVGDRAGYPLSWANPEAGWPSRWRAMS